MHFDDSFDKLSLVLVTKQSKNGFYCLSQLSPYKYSWVGRVARDIYIKKGKINHFKIKIISFIVNFRWNYDNYAICHRQIQVLEGASF